MTIPALIQKTQNQEYVTALQKFYSEANQALVQTAFDEGTPGKLGAATTDDLTADIVSHFKKNKDCGYNTGKGCLSFITKNYDGTGGGSNWDTDDTYPYYKFITVDGIRIEIEIVSKDCSTPISSDINVPTHNECGALWVDINGERGPNRRGRDVFQFVITSNKAPFLYPSGGKYDSYWKDDNSCQAGNTDGHRCAGRIMEEGWQMNY